MYAVLSDFKCFIVDDYLITHFDSHVFVNKSANVNYYILCNIYYLTIEFNVDL